MFEINLLNIEGTVVPITMISTFISNKNTISQYSEVCPRPPRILMIFPQNFLFGDKLKAQSIFDFFSGKVLFSLRGSVSLSVTHRQNSYFHKEFSKILLTTLSFTVQFDPSLF